MPLIALKTESAASVANTVTLSHDPNSWPVKILAVAFWPFWSFQAALDNEALMAIHSVHSTEISVCQEQDFRIMWCYSSGLHAHNITPIYYCLTAAKKRCLLKYYLSCNICLLAWLINLLGMQYFKLQMYICNPAHKTVYKQQWHSLWATCWYKSY